MKIKMEWDERDGSIVIKLPGTYTNPIDRQTYDFSKMSFDSDIKDPFLLNTEKMGVLVLDETVDGEQYWRPAREGEVQ